MAPWLVSEWDTFARLAQHDQAKPLLDRVGDGQGVHDLLANWPPDIPRGTGGLEAEPAHIRGVLASRSSQLTNIARTNTMGDLVVMFRRGQGSAPSYTRALHAALTLARGRAALQKVGVNGGPRLQNS